MVSAVTAQQENTALGVWLEFRQRVTAGCTVRQALRYKCCVQLDFFVVLLQLRLTAVLVTFVHPVQQRKVCVQQGAFVGTLLKKFNAHWVHFALMAQHFPVFAMVGLIALHQPRK
jgi:hypothetical protein